MYEFHITLITSTDNDTDGFPAILERKIDVLATNNQIARLQVKPDTPDSVCATVRRCAHCLAFVLCCLQCLHYWQCTDEEVLESSKNKKMLKLKQNNYFGVPYDGTHNDRLDASCHVRLTRIAQANALEPWDPFNEAKENRIRPGV